MVASVSPVIETRRRSVAGSAILVMLASALSTVLGFGREIITAHFYGTHSEVDAFLNASTVPTVLFGIFNGALVGALVPTFSEYMSTGHAAEVRRLGSSVLFGLLFLLSALAALGWLIAPLFVPIIAHGFSPSEQDLEVRMVRWLMPGIVATGLSGVLAALANANHRFLASSMVWVAANIVTIGSVVLLHQQLGIFALVLGSVLGLFAQLLVQAPTMIRDDLIRFEIDLRHPGLRKTWALLLPIAVGSGAGQINIAFDRYFASNLSAGSTAAIGYTTKVSYLPIQIIAIAIGTVIFPLMARQFASSDSEGIKRSASRALQMVAFIVIPCAAGLTALSHPIIQTLFERGAFGVNATTVCAALVPFACLPLIATSFTTVLGRACLACKAVYWAVAIGVSSVVFNVMLSAYLSPRLGASGLLLANGIAGFYGSALLLLLLSRMIDGLNWTSIGISFLRTIIAASLMLGVLHYIQLLPLSGPTTLPFRVLDLSVLVVVGAATFFGVARALGSDEIVTLISMVKRKLIPKMK